VPSGSGDRDECLLCAIGLPANPMEVRDRLRIFIQWAKIATGEAL